PPAARRRDAGAGRAGDRSHAHAGPYAGLRVLPDRRRPVRWRYPLHAGLWHRPHRLPRWRRPQPVSFDPPAARPAAHDSPLPLPRLQGAGSRHPCLGDDGGGAAPGQRARPRRRWRGRVRRHARSAGRRAARPGALAAFHPGEHSRRTLARACGQRGTLSQDSAAAARLRRGRANRLTRQYMSAPAAAKSPPPRHATVAVIGAGDFIGAAIARRFAAEGYIVFVGRRQGEKLEPLKAEIEASGGRVFGRSLDARDEDDVSAFLREAEAEAPLEVCVFNVGANVNFPILETTSRVFRKVWEMACYSGFLAGREAARHMLPRGRGSIFFTGATAGMRGGAGFAAFASAKFGLRALAQSC